MAVNMRNYSRLDLRWSKIRGVKRSIGNPIFVHKAVEGKHGSVLKRLPVIVVVPLVSTPSTKSLTVFPLRHKATWYQVLTERLGLVKVFVAPLLPAVE